MLKNYCCRCGTAMEPRFMEGRTREVCPACGYVHYRNPVPAVGVVVQQNEGIVLVRRKFEPCAGYWGLPAGYMEMGETAEEAAIRECFEETGLLVQTQYLIGVYSYGDRTSSGLVIIYAAIVLGGELQAGDDAIDVGVFPVDALPSPMAFRTHLQAIERWRHQERLSVAQPDVLLQTEQGVLVRRAQYYDDRYIRELLPFLPDSSAVSEVPGVLADALFHDRLHDPDRPILVAEASGVVAGFTAMSFRQTLVGWRATVDELAVAPGYRRQGLGQALIEAAVRLAQSRRCPILHIDTTQGSPDAMAFYRACGFADHRVATMRIG